MLKDVEIKQCGVFDVLWEPPAFNSGGGSIKGYLAEVAMDNKTWHNCTTNSEGRSCLFKGLFKKTKYHVRVQAFNTKGASDWSYGFISAGLSGMLQTHIQSLICIRAVINGEDLVNSRCIKRMKAEENPKRRHFFFLRASICLSTCTFLCENK